LDLAVNKAGLQTFKHTQDGLTDKEKLNKMNLVIVASHIFALAVVAVISQNGHHTQAFTHHTVDQVNVTLVGRRG